MYYKCKKLFYRYGSGRAKLAKSGLLIVLCLSLFIGLSTYEPRAVTVSVEKEGLLQSELSKILRLMNLDSEIKLRQIISQGCPLIWNGENINPREQKTLAFFNKVIAFFTDIDSSNPLSIFSSQWAILGQGNSPKMALASVIKNEIEEDFYLNSPAEIENWHFEMEKASPLDFEQEALVLIYNTHNAETYKPTHGKSKEEGKNSGIATVAQVMAETLENTYKIKTVRSQTIHDYPDFTRSYLNSMNTARDLLAVNKKIQAVFDIHRDAGIPSKSTTTFQINNKNIASIIIVIGTEHEGWRQNLAFAEALEAKAGQLYPGLIRDIRLAQNRRYNQNLHPHSLILEIGSDLNTLEEAKESIKLFSHVLSQVLRG